MSFRIMSVAIHAELDVVASRQRARQVAALCGFGLQDQARIATAVSELARNVYNYASHGTVEFAIEGESAPQMLSISIQDQGPGINDLPLVLSGRYRSTTGMGLGIIGARRLMDRCDISSQAGRGTTAVLKKLLPKNAPLLTARQIGDMSRHLAMLPPDALFSEVQQQNTELLGTLAELKARQDELLQLTRELEDTNRGVVALYAELDEKAEHLRRADEMKSRFLSNMSHEFRTPLSSIRALSKLLLNRTDGELTQEQEKQVQYILKSTESLAELVDDLLDLAKIEAGKIDVRPEKFDVADLFSALRGMMRPLLTSDAVKLIFEQPADGCFLVSDEAKISQILRNFISNALKFTETGEVRVSAHMLPKEGTIRFSVADTGLGISPEHQQLIFEEFGQIESHLQQKVKGTGLGLPLCRKLAALMGGEVGVESVLGRGSVFTVTLPLVHSHRQAIADQPPHESGPAANDSIVLFVSNQNEANLTPEEFFQDSGFAAVFSRGFREADDILNAAPLAAIVLYIAAEDEESWRWLVQVKSVERYQRIPLIAVTASHEREKAFSLGADDHLFQPASKDGLLAALLRLVDPGAASAPVLGDQNDDAFANAESFARAGLTSKDQAESSNRI